MVKGSELDQRELISLKSFFCLYWSLIEKNKQLQSRTHYIVHLPFFAASDFQTIMKASPSIVFK